MGGGNAKQQTNIGHLIALHQILIETHERQGFQVTIQPQSHKETSVLQGIVRLGFGLVVNNPIGVDVLGLGRDL